MTAFPSTPCQVRRRGGPLDRPQGVEPSFSASAPTRYLPEHWHDILGLLAWLRWNTQYYLQTSQGKLP